LSVCPPDNDLASDFLIVEMDCPICALSKGLNDKEELVDHMKLHKNNPDLVLEKFADYIAAREFSRELQ
jgi:hypothetical protein